MNDRRTTVLGLATALPLLLAAQTQIFPVDLIVPAWRGDNTVAKAGSDGSATFTFSGEFPKENEYELFTTPLPVALDPRTSYELRFEYRADEPVDNFVFLYPAGTGGDDTWGDAGANLQPAAEWTEAVVPLTDRFLHNNFGSKPGAALRLHFRTWSRQITDGPRFGKPLTVSVRNARIMPSAEQPGRDGFPLAIASSFGNSHRTDGDVTAIRFEGNFREVGTRYVQYDAITTPLGFPLCPDVKYNLCFDYKGDAADTFTAVYYNTAPQVIDGSQRKGGDNSAAIVSALPAAADWTPVCLPLEGRELHNHWGYRGKDNLLLRFNDSRRRSHGDPLFGQPMNVNLRNIRIVPAD